MFPETGKTCFAWRRKNKEGNSIRPEVRYRKDKLQQLVRYWKTRYSKRPGMESAQMLENRPQ